MSRLRDLEKLDLHTFDTLDFHNRYILARNERIALRMVMEEMLTRMKRFDDIEERAMLDRAFYWGQE